MLLYAQTLRMVGNGLLGVMYGNLSIEAEIHSQVLQLLSLGVMFLNLPSKNTYVSDT